MNLRDVLDKVSENVELIAGSTGLDQRVVGVDFIESYDESLGKDHLAFLLKPEMSAAVFDMLIRRVSEAESAGLIIHEVRLTAAHRANAEALRVPIMVVKGPFRLAVAKISGLLLNEENFSLHWTLTMVEYLNQAAMVARDFDEWLDTARTLVPNAIWENTSPEVGATSHHGTVFLDRLSIGRWVDPDAALSPTLMSQLAMTTMAVAERLMSAWTREWEANREYLTRLLEGINGQGRSMSAVQHLSWNFEQPSVLMLLTMDGITTNPLGRWRAIRRWLESVEQSVRRLGYNALLFPYEDYLAVVMQGAPGTLTPGQLIAVARQLAKLGFGSVGIGRAHTGIGGLRASLAEAQEALVVGQSEDESVVYFSQLGIRRYLFGWYDSPRSVQLSQELLAPLYMDTDAHAGLIETLKAFLRKGGRLSATAQSLNIHRNTLRYRLDRIGEILGLDLNDTDTLLILQLAWRAFERHRPYQSAQSSQEKFRPNVEDLPDTTSIE